MSDYEIRQYIGLSNGVPVKPGELERIYTELMEISFGKRHRFVTMDETDMRNRHECRRMRDVVSRAFLRRLKKAGLTLPWWGNR